MIPQTLRVKFANWRKHRPSDLTHKEVLVLKSTAEKDGTYYDQLQAVQQNSAFWQEVLERRADILADFTNIEIWKENEKIELRVAFLQGELNEMQWLKDHILNKNFKVPKKT